MLNTRYTGNYLTNISNCLTNSGGEPPYELVSVFSNQSVPSRQGMHHPQLSCL